MGIFGKKKSEPEKSGPIVIDPDAFLIDKGRMLVDEERFMEAAMAFEEASNVFRAKLAGGRSGDEPSELMASAMLAAALGNHALVLTRNLHRSDEALPIAQEAVAVIQAHGALGGMLEEHERILRTVEQGLASS